MSGLDTFGSDLWKEFGSGWDSVHQGAKPYVKKVSDAVPFVKSFVDAGDTLEDAYQKGVGNPSPQAAAKAKEQATAKAQADAEAMKKAHDEIIDPAKNKPPESGSLVARQVGPLKIWVWALIGGLAIVIIGGLVMVIRRKRNSQ